MFILTDLVLRLSTKKTPLEEEFSLSFVPSMTPWGSLPHFLPAKAIQQDLCLKGLGWDDPTPETSKQKWEAWLREPQ